jgi:hypothetical protein
MPKTAPAELAALLLSATRFDVLWISDIEAASECKASEHGHSRNSTFFSGFQW